jgi:hypothetical protein
VGGGTCPVPDVLTVWSQETDQVVEQEGLWPLGDAGLGS